MDALIVRTTWWTRLLRRVGLLPTGETEHSAGADYLPGVPAFPGMDPQSSMSAHAAFPWVYACGSAISTDLSCLPLRAVRGSGDDAETLDDHPVLRLLDQPSSRVSGTLYRRQTYLDTVLTGTGFSRVIGMGDPLALLNVPPARIVIHPWRDGQPGFFSLTTTLGNERLAWDEVLLFRLPSWEDDARSLYGTGTVRPLAEDLTTDLAAKRSASRTAQFGRPTGIISPKDAGDVWSRDQVTLMRDAFDREMRHTSGVLFLGGAAAYEQLGFSPRDMEFVQQHEKIRESILAVMDVPPARVGLPNTNYATAQAQARRYWEGLQGRAKLFDAQFTRLARMFAGSDEVRVVHDFSAVEALQESRTERVARVRQWWEMGVPVDDAARLEGFDELGGVEAAAPTESDEEADARALARLLAPPPRWIAPIGEPARAAEWRGFAEQLHAPAERALTLQARRFLAGQSRRLARRTALVLGAERAAVGETTRQIGDSALASIFAAADEAALMDEALRPTMAAAVERAYRRALAQVGVRGLEFDPVRADRLVDLVIGEMIANVGETTKATVRQVIVGGLEAGRTIAEVQEILIGHPDFAPARALRIARTETTRAVNAGAVEAYKAATDAGVSVRKQWLSARDDVVREEHVEADGAIAEVDQPFDLAFGSASAPGGFGVAEFDINCRCTVIPIVEST